jgi:hypothetical protein
LQISGYVGSRRHDADAQSTSLGRGKLLDSTVSMACQYRSLLKTPEVAEQKEGQRSTSRELWVRVRQT